jgi:hypothetical protein
MTTTQPTPNPCRFCGDVATTRSQGWDVCHDCSDTVEAVARLRAQVAFALAQKEVATDAAQKRAS